jgi:aminoglycoside 3-N-acetyltransferase
MASIEKEKKIIEQTQTPHTRTSLAADLRRLGVSAGMTVIVHTAMSRLGWVCGGPVALIQALLDVVTDEGTLVMPAHSGDYSDPAQWNFPPVPPDWVPIIRANMPAFDPAWTPTRGMGQVPELFRTLPGVLRSNHPQLSFSAWGKHAGFITKGHSLAYSMGEGSPLARIYELNGHVLLLGVGYSNNTSMHLAEYRAGIAQKIRQGSSVYVDGKARWVEFDDIDFDDEPFSAIGAAYEKQGGEVRVGYVGNAECRLMPQRSIVDFTARWIAAQG